MENNRTKTALKALIVALCLNIALGVMKLVFGALSHSVSVMSDSANNLSDACVTIVTITAFALATKTADKEHPYGHGRYEYIVTLILGLVVLFVAFQLIISSVQSLINTNETLFTDDVLIMLAVSIAVKIFMSALFGVYGKKLNSDALLAVRLDSLFDAIVTVVVLVAAIVQRYTGVGIDGYAGIAVALFILFGGCKTIAGTVNRLLGNRADPKTEESLKELILRQPNIIGYHDLVVHDYGVENKVASVHAEMDRNLSLVQAHQIADELEHEVKEKMNIAFVVHCDPIDTSDPVINRIGHVIKDILRNYNATYHDLAIYYEEKKVTFDVRLQERYAKQIDFIKCELEAAVKTVIGDCDSEITIDIV